MPKAFDDGDLPGFDSRFANMLASSSVGIKTSVLLMQLGFSGLPIPVRGVSMSGRSGHDSVFRGSGRRGLF